MFSLDLINLYSDVIDFTEDAQKLRGVLVTLLSRRASALERLHKAVSFTLEKEGAQFLEHAFKGHDVLEDLVRLFATMDTRRTFSRAWTADKIAGQELYGIFEEDADGELEGETQEEDELSRSLVEDVDMVVPSVPRPAIAATPSTN